MEQFKLTVALNRGIDRSDEMARGFTLPLLHPFSPRPPSLFYPPPPLNHGADFFSTAEFHLYVNEEKGAILKTPSPSPLLLQPHHTTTHKESAGDQCGLVRTLNDRSPCVCVSACGPPSHCPIQSKCDPADPPSPAAQALSASSPQPPLMAPACLLTPRENGKHMLDWAK